MTKHLVWVAIFGVLVSNVMLSVSVLISLRVLFLIYIWVELSWLGLMV